MNSALSLVTPPVGEPITLSGAKAHLRIDGTDDDDLVTSLITAACRAFDGRDAWFGRALITQTWDLFLDDLPYGSGSLESSYAQPEICVPLPPLQSVTSITYVDLTGSPQVLDPSEYTVDAKSEPGRIFPAYGKSWPVARCAPNAVTVRFVAGYGAASAVPEDIKLWLKQAVAYFFENRGATSLPQAFFWSMANYKVAWGF